MTTRTAPPPGSTRRDDIILAAITALWLGLVLTMVAPALRVPPHVERITIENPHPWIAHVEVNEPGNNGWLGIGIVDRDHEQNFRSVVDQGDVWIFRFTYGGQPTEMRVTRRQLAADDWHVTIPDDFARRLSDAGLPEAPTA